MINKTAHEPRTIRRIEIPHENNKIVFNYPLYSSETYRVVRERILNANQKLPVGEYIASLLHSVYFSVIRDKMESKNIRDKLRDYGLWIFHLNSWTKEGVYIVQDMGTEKKYFEFKDLEKMLKGGKEISGIRFSKDGRVRFAPKSSYAEDPHSYDTSEKFSKDGFIIASFGEEGAEKLGEIGSKFFGNNFSISTPFLKEIKFRDGVSCIRVFKDKDNHKTWLCFDGYERYDYSWELERGDFASAIGLLKR